MRDIQIKLVNYELLNIKECTIHQAFNEHAEAVISGHIHEEMEEWYLRKSLTEERAEIIGEDESGNSFFLFCGMIKEISILNIKGAKGVRITLCSSSFLTDLMPKTRCFQDLSITYDQVLDIVMENYEQPFACIQSGGTKVIDQLIVQYEETDWEFIKRIASHFETYVVPDILSKGVSISIGVPFKRKPKTIEVLEYSIKGQRTCFYYEIKSREYCHIGDCILFENQQLFVCSVDSSLEGEELIHTYKIKNKEDIVCKRYTNNAMIGASLEGHVTDIQNDRVKVKIDQDACEAGKKWFDYATIYSSPDGTGWYCMPEKGDRVRVYFPNEEENNAYVISSVHVGDNEADARTKPDEKSIKNKYGKEILFKPDSLIITNNKGMLIEINDNEGISIVSDKSVSIKSEEAINITSIEDSLQMVAMEEVALKQNESSIVISEDVVIDGGEVKMV